MMEQIASHLCYGGEQLRFKHNSDVLQCEMRFSLFLPSRAKQQKVPLLYWLSGLTCNDENFVQKAGAQRYAEQHGVAIVTPDTSPRGEDIPDDNDGAYDLGLGAGFYLNATSMPWKQHYQMYDYIVNELPALMAQHFPVESEQQSIMGHSMGGHGALVIGLRNPGRYCSVSAFAPICAPMRCPWGQKAFSNYLGDDQLAWRAYDATELIAKAEKKVPLLVDQGESDEFLQEQLQPACLEQACRDRKYPLAIHYRSGYDHSYFFIASFIGEHIAFHAAAFNDLR